MSRVPPNEIALNEASNLEIIIAAVIDRDRMFSVGFEKFFGRKLKRFNTCFSKLADLLKGFSHVDIK